MPHRGARHQQLPASHRRPSTPRQEVAEPASRHRSHTPEEVGNGSYHAHPRDAHVAFVFQVIRQPAGVQPQDIDGPEETRDHPPSGSMRKQVPPLAERWRTRVGVLIPFRQVPLFLRRQANLGWIAMNHPPHPGKHYPDRADNDEHPPPAERQHQKGEQRHRNEIAQRRSGLAKASGESPLANPKPVAYHPSATRKQGGLSHAQRETCRNKGPEVCDEAARRLCHRPTEKSQPEQSSRTIPVDQPAHR